MSRALDEALKQAADISAMAYANLFVNGFHAVSQEIGTAAKPVAGMTYITDQWLGGGAGSWSGTLQQVASPFPSQPDIGYGLKLAITTAQVSLGAGDYVAFLQPMEGTNLGRLRYGSANARPVTLAFMVRPSIDLTGYVRLGAQNASNVTVRSRAERFFAPANTDTLICLTIPGDQASALLTTNASGINAHWCFGSGTTYQGVTGQWVAGNVLCGADCTNLAAAVGNNVIISGAVMIPGDFKISQDVLPLLQRRYDDELRLCRRYYYKWSGLLYPPDFGKGAYGALNWQHPTPMRVAASINTDLGVPAGSPGGSYGSVQTNSPDGFMLRTDTSGSQAYAQLTYIIANSRM